MGIKMRYQVTFTRTLKQSRYRYYKDYHSAVYWAGYHERHSSVSVVSIERIDYTRSEIEKLSLEQLKGLHKSLVIGKGPYRAPTIEWV